MIDIEKAKNEFMKYVSGYDITNPNISFIKSNGIL